MSKKQTSNPKNFMLMLSAFLVVALGIMSYVLLNQNRQIAVLNDNIEAIQDDLDEINFDGLDREVLGIQTELSSD